MRWLTLGVAAMILMLAGCDPGTMVPTPAPGVASATPAGPAPTLAVRASVGGETPVPPPLFLELIEPAEETVEVAESAASITIVGRSLPTAVVSVNGELASPDASGVFRAVVALEDEMTLIEVVASDASGAEERVELMVVR